MKVTAIIPAKGESRRLPRKNMQPFGDSTLIGHKVDQLLACAAINEVVVGSDDSEILDEASAHGAEIRVRDTYHCDESQCSANEMIRNLAAMVECDVVVWAHCTNPLVGPESYDEAVRMFLRRDEFATDRNYDSLCSVKHMQRHAWRAGGGGPVPVNFNPWSGTHPFASELEPMYFQDGAIFIQPHRQMLDNAYFYGRCPLFFTVGEPYSIDIDTEHDLSLARHWYDILATHGLLNRKAVTS